MFAAVQRGDADAVRALLESARATGTTAAVAQERDTADTGATPLHAAAGLSDGSLAASLIATLLDAGADADALDAHSRSPLLCATEAGNSAACLALIPAANVALSDRFGRTALHWACQQGLLDVVAALGATGKADVNATTTSGDTALHWTCQRLSTAALPVLHTLLSLGADATRKNKMGQPPAAVLSDNPATPEAEIALATAASEVQAQRDAMRAVASTGPTVGSGGGDGAAAVPSGSGASTAGVAAGAPAAAVAAPATSSALPVATSAVRVGVKPAPKKKKLTVTLRKKK